MINIIIHEYFIIFLQICEIIWCMNIFKIKEFVIFIMKIFSDFWCIFFDIFEFKKFNIWKTANYCFSCIFMIIYSFYDSYSYYWRNDIYYIIWIMWYRIWIWFIDDFKDFIKFQCCSSRYFSDFIFIRFEIMKYNFLELCIIIYHDDDYVYKLNEDLIEVFELM